MMNRLPAWFKQELPDDKVFNTIKLINKASLNTVCQHAKCPNINKCFKSSRITFMILGDSCSRACRFCAVKKSEAGRISHKDDSEPRRIAEFIASAGLKYAVITSVTRDDLSDGGASVFAQTIRQIRLLNKDTAVEALIPDLSADINNIKVVIDAQPSVLAHNIETVKRLYPLLRPDSDYGLSLSVLKKIKALNSRLFTKSAIMLGLGEAKQEVFECMNDLKSAGCDILVLGQYLAPSRRHYPVQYFLTGNDFKEYEDMAKGLRFRVALSSPLFRSSYNAEEVYREVCNA